MHVVSLIEKYFAQGLSVDEKEKMRAHLRVCQKCREHYDQYAEVLRSAAGKLITENEIREIQSSVINQTNVEEGRLATEIVPPSRSLMQRRWFIPSLAGALGTIAIAALALLLLPSGPEKGGSSKGTLTSEVQYRGAATRPVHSLINLEMFAISPLPGGKFSDPRPVPHDGQVALSDLVQFAYQNDREELRYLFIVGVDEQGQLIDYFPRPEDEQSLPLTSTTSSLRAIAPSLRLNKRHAAGKLSVWGIFSTQPLTRTQVKQALTKINTASEDAILDLGSSVVTVRRNYRLVNDARGKQ